MNELQDNERLNAEGYCKNCGKSLGIEGICYSCEIDKNLYADIIENVFTCPICGQPKTHHRLYGYRCGNPEHADGIR